MRQEILDAVKKAISSFLLFVLVFVGCHTPKQLSRVPLEDVRAIVILYSLITSDGGTIEIVAKTDPEGSCVVRLNQTMFSDGYPLGETDSPGRLCFNGNLIDVRSDEETHLITLMLAADFSPLEFDEAVWKFVPDTTDPAGHIEELKQLRDRIVNYVNSEAYVEVAENGVPGDPRNG